MDTRSYAHGAVRAARRGRLHVFGKLESVVMDELWAAGEPLSVREVLERFAARRPVAYNTVMTVMNRLVEKRVLRRRKKSGVWHYQPRQDRATFEAQLSRSVIEDLLQIAPHAAVLQFVDAVAAAQPEVLDELERLIQEHRRVEGK